MVEAGSMIEQQSDADVRGADAAGDELRARLRGMWASVAGAWQKHAGYVDERGAPITEKMLERTLPQPGERVLELASGPGSVGLAAAPRVAPDGEVVISDVVAEMTSIAAARAEASGLGIVFDTVSAQLGAPTPPPGIPHPFSLDDADRLAALLAAAGLSAVSVDEVTTPYEAASVDEWWGRSCALAGPLAQKLAQLPQPAAQALRARAADAARRYRTPGGGLHIPGVSLIAAAGRIRTARATRVLHPL